MGKKFNPTEFREEALDLMKTNPELAAQSVTALARRARNASDNLESAEEATKNLIAFLGSIVVMGAVGAWAGSIDAKRDALIADWETSGAQEAGASLTDADEPWKHENGVRDPSSLWFFPKLLLVPVGLGALTLITSASRKGKGTAGTFERFAGMSAIGTFGLFVARMVGGWMYRRKEAKLEALNNESVRTAA